MLTKSDLGPSPLSFQQRRLWFLQQYDPQSAAYNLPRAFRLKGTLNVDALEQAFNALIARHSVLRTVFELCEGEPQQRVLNEWTFRLRVESARTLESGALEAWLLQRIRAESAQPFDLPCAPLIRVTLIDLGPLEQVLLITLHHIVSDAGSNLTLMRDLASAYRAALNRQAPVFPALPLTYTEYAEAQRERHEAGELEAGRAYWNSYLGTELPQLSLPLDRPRAEGSAAGSAAYTFHLPMQMLSAFETFCFNERITPFVLLLAGWQWVLSRYSGQRDFTIGVPNAARNRVELQDLVGFFVNTQVYRARLDGALTARELCRRLRGEWLSALQYAEFPFELLLEQLSITRDAAANPLFQTLFNMRAEQDVRAIELSGLAVEPIEVETAQTKCDLSLDVSVSRERVVCRIEYDAALFKADTIKRLSAQYAHALEQIVRMPDQPLRQLPACPPAELRQILAWSRNDQSPRWSQSEPVFRQIEVQAAQTPDATAVRFESSALTFAQLNQRANKLARHLRSLGVGPEILVGVALERSLDLVVALLAVMKAGGAYLPLDPSYPRDRLAYMLNDSRAPLLITELQVLETSSLEVSDESSRTQVWCIDRDWSDIEHYASTDLSNLTTLQNAAYCIYTSGSTGRPKAAINTHGGLANRLAWMQSEYGLTSADRVLQKTPFSFDVSVWEFFWPLMTGATLVVAAPGIHRDPTQLRELIQTADVTTLHFVPSMLQAFIQAGELTACTSLRQVFCSGEALPDDLQQDFLNQSAASLHNLYGPTEASIDVTYWQCRVDADSQSVPIGRPISRTTTYVLDANLAPVPIGAVGELYLGGIGLARGYHGQASLTAERFVPNPLAGQSGERLYRAGDLARWRHDGVIEYLGRIDNQVKIRGFRIELGEIESALRAHPAVRDAALIARDIPGGKQLAAYVVCEPLTLLEIKSALRANLPDYMLPSAWVVLDRLPVTSNGKLDRRALPEPQTSGSAHEAVAPRNEIERRLTEIWRRALRNESIGIQDNFFECGGDSIIAIQVVSQAREQGIDIRPKHLFQHQSIEALAAVAQRASPSHYDTGPLSGKVPLTPIQHGFFETPMPDRNHWNQAVLIRPEKPWDAASLEQSLRRLISHHDAFRLRFTRNAKGEWEQRYGELGDDSLLWTVEAAVTELEPVIARAQRSLHLENGPLIRAVLINLSNDGGQRLLIVVHHLVIDGVSWRILLEDLQAPSLGAKTHSFAVWSNALARYSQSADLQGQLEYWRAIGSNHTPSLPSRSPYALNTVGSAVTINAEIPAAGLRHSVNEILLTALSHTLCDWSGNDSLLIELEGHGREDLFPDINMTRTLGWFTTRFPLCLPSGLSVAAVKQQLQAISDNGIGYGVLRYLTPHGRVLGVNAQPQVTFNYLGRFESTGAVEFVGDSQSPTAPRRSWIEVNAAVSDDRLHIRWTYSRSLHDELTMERLVNRFVDSVQTLSASVHEDSYPLSPMQQGMLFHSLGAASRNIYVMQLGVTIQGLDPERLAQAWNATVERHAILRTGFDWKDEHSAPMQRVHREASMPFELWDWSGRSDIDRALVDIAQAEQARKLDLAQPPLMRIVCVRLSEQEHRMIWTFHHLLLDGWSVSKLIVEVLQRYEGRPPSAAPRPYRDYIQWLARTNQDLSEHFWKARLEALDEPTLLAPAAANRNLSTGHSVLHTVLTEHQTARLRELARREHVTLNTVIQGAWTLLLQRYTGQRAVAFGAVVSGRPPDLVGAHDMIGLFINTVPVIQVPRPEQAVGDWLRALQSLNVELREHEHVPLHEIQRWAGRGGHALFDSIIVFENYPVDAALSGHDGRSVRFSDIEHVERTNYSMTVIVSVSECIRVQLSYSKDHFDERGVAMIRDHLEELLRQMADDPHQRLSQLSLLNLAQRHAAGVLASGEMRQLESSSVVDLFERQCLLTPGTIAVEADSGTLTYRELQFRSNAWAQELRRRGVSADSRVGIFAASSVERAIAVLAVLKAGAAYVPIDPQHPSQRIAYMLRNAGAQWVLTDEKAPLPADYSGQVLWMGRSLNHELPVEPDAANHPDQLAYVMYTSGSTGQPKGVAMRHGALSQLMQWHRSKWPGGCRTLQFASIGFDVSFQELFTAWTTGGTLVLPTESARRNFQHLAALLGEREIERVFLPMAVLQPLVEGWVASGRRLPKLRQMISAGEALQLTPTLREWLRTHPQCALINQYGPTEAHVVSDFDATPTAASDSVAPIGRPIWNTQLLLLDEHLNVIPAGIAGDLYISGDALAQGYWADAARTADRFIPNPYASGARMYRTGDRARYRVDGNIEFLGRSDHQIKIRGYRIEPGEIEVALRNHSKVKQAAVVVRESHAGKQIVAYVVTEGAAEADLKRELSAHLPDYMVPARIVTLPKIPLTANGKLDRRSLPSLEDLHVDRPRVGPRNAVEASLAEIWSEVLGIGEIGIHDHFFELGGHSLAAVHVQLKVQARLSLALPAEAIFKHPTIESLAEYLAEKLARSDADEQRELSEMQALLNSLEQ